MVPVVVTGLLALAVAGADAGLLLLVLPLLEQAASAHAPSTAAITVKRRIAAPICRVLA
jgi:hypothetical protein